MRLIDADALIKEHCDGCEYYDSHFCTPADPVCGAVEVMNDAQTIDAVEVKHGRWIKKTADCIYYYACSECGEPVLRSQWGCDFFSEFCPNCGAKMDGERKDE